MENNKKSTNPDSQNESYEEDFEHMSEEILAEDGNLEAEENNSNLEEEQSPLEIVQNTDNYEDSNFDRIVGDLETIIMSEEFQLILQNFYQKYSTQFENIEENKLVYMDIFKEYINTVEAYLEDQIGNEDIQWFSTMIMKKEREIDGPILEMLTSFTDFQIFKELMLSHKQEEVQKMNELGLLLTGVKSQLHDIQQNQQKQFGNIQELNLEEYKVEEEFIGEEENYDEDGSGEDRPDLDLTESLVITKLDLSKKK